MNRTDAVERQLRHVIEGEVRWDALSRELYSTDASIYRFEPAGVVIPKTRADVIRTVQACRQHGVPITARGAGTSLAGQAVGSGVQLDFSRYLDRIVELNAAERWVRVEPGVVLDNLNRVLEPHGLQFGPDVATSSRANLGGMIANNSSGARSLVHGLTSDHVMELEVVLADGSICHLKPLSGQALTDKRAQRDLEGRLYREIPALAQTHREEIARRFPRILRRVSGYNLVAFVDDATPVDLCQIIAGSEGTLALILEAKLKLVPLPSAKTLMVAAFPDVLSAAGAVPRVLQHQPGAVEMVDKLILDQTRGSPEFLGARELLGGDPGAVLLVEFWGESLAQLRDKMASVGRDLQSQTAATACAPIVDPGQQAQIWGLRKAGVGILMAVKGDAKPYAFVEDAAVSPEKLEEYVRRFHEIVADHDTYAGWYGHASVGCLHVRPVVDLKTAAGREMARSMLDRVSDLVADLGGSLSAEHGDGVVRGAYLQKMFGDRLYEAFRAVKRTFDPDGLLNPGRVVDAPDPLQNLRTLPSVADIPEMRTTLDYSADGGFYRSIEMCSGVGHCRKTATGSMCPSYMATRDEAHCTRGRANTLRAALEGRFEGGLTGTEVRQVMDLCLSCKACKNECPSSVDMAKHKSVFLDTLQRENGVSLRNWLVGHVDLLAPVLSALAPLVNWLSHRPWMRWLAEKLLGLDRRRAPPRFVARSLPRQLPAKRLKTRPSARVAAPASPTRNPDDVGQLVLLADCWTKYSEPQVGLAAVSVLEKTGYSVVLGDTRCCGRPAISKGLLSRALALAQHNVKVLHRHVRAGRIIVGVEPSCLLTLRDEYIDLLPAELGQQAREVAGASLLIDELLAELPDRVWQNLRFDAFPHRVLVHGHCHQKALAGMDALKGVLGRVPEIELQVLDASCCGMAGFFGYEAEHYALSEACAERILAPAVRAEDASGAVLAAGFSCRHQIQHFAHRTAMHPIEFLAGLLSGEPTSRAEGEQRLRVDHSV